MGCNCGGARRLAAAQAKGSSYVYDFIAPTTGEIQTFSTPLEAKRAVRQHGGGTVRRRTVSAAA